MRNYATKEDAFRSGLEALREAKSDLPSFCLFGPNVHYSPDELETRSAEERTTSNWTDFQSDSTLSPFESLDPWSGSSSRGLSVDSWKGFLDPRSRNSISSVSPTPDFSAPISQSQAPSNFTLHPTSTSIGSLNSKISPLLSDAYPELVDHFCDYLAPLLVLTDSYNPFMEYLTPLAAYPVVETALQALSSAQLENINGHVHPRQLDLHSKALQSLAISIGTEDPRDEDVPLAATLLLLHYEVSDQLVAKALFDWV